MEVINTMSQLENKTNTPLVVNSSTEKLFKNLHPDYAVVFDYFVKEGLIEISDN